MYLFNPFQFSSFFFDKNKGEFYTKFFIILILSGSVDNIDRTNPKTANITVMSDNKMMITELKFFPKYKKELKKKQIEYC
jgi:hypothetical protein